MKGKLVNFPRRTSLRQLRALGAVAGTGGVTAAAAQLSLTPPAVAQQLKLLEDALGGVPLLERTPAGMRPTEAGQEALAALGRIEAALADCAAAIEALRGMEGGRVAVGVTSTAKYFAPFALAAFQRAHPGVEMRLSVGNRQQVVAALEGFELDVAVMGYPPDHFPVERAVLGPHPHLIIAPPGHPLARRRAIPLGTLAGETFLLREPGSGTRDLMRRLFGAEIDGPRMEIGSNETIKQAVMAGMGIALLSAHTIAAELRDGRLAVLDVAGLPAAQAMWDHLARHGAAFLPALPGEDEAHHASPVPAKPAGFRR
jgi:LysR family transcriptional regulator, low CO2-responsive transcriptional regulator